MLLYTMESERLYSSEFKTPRSQEGIYQLHSEYSMVSYLSRYVMALDCMTLNLFWAFAHWCPETHRQQANFDTAFEPTHGKVYVAEIAS